MTTLKTMCGALLAVGLLAWTPTAHAEEGTFSFESLTPETAARLAKATLDACRAEGYQVAVAVVDRGGNLQALIRDRFAGAHTPETARMKAYTAVSFRTATTALAENSQAGKEGSGVRHIPGVLALGGGVMIEKAGSLLGGVGVSGAPAGALDEKCATKGLEDIMDVLAF